MTKPIGILILTNDDERQSRWSAAVSQVGSVWCSTADVVGSVDIAITDRPVDRETAGFADAGRILVGADGPADVSLPGDATPRELRLACRLLAEIVRLRQERKKDRRERKVLALLAQSDPLTGLPNRRAWDAELQVRAGACGAPDEPGFAVAIFDLDYFKRVNDEQGHVAGDRVLRQFARQIQQNIRSDDYAARLGGDEFGLLLAGPTGEQLQAVVERVRWESCRGTGITASAGFAFPSNSQDMDPEAVFAAADEALRLAKSAGRDRTIAAS